jgi:hypothetical protein
MDYGIQIYLPQLNTISVAKDGKSVKIGGGVNSKKLTDALWDAGKQTGRLYNPQRVKCPSDIDQLPELVNVSAS